MSAKNKNRVFLTVANSIHENYARVAVMSARDIFKAAKEQREANGLSKEDMESEMAPHVLAYCDTFFLDENSKADRKLALNLLYLASKTGTFAVYPVEVDGLCDFQHRLTLCAQSFKDAAARADSRVFLALSASIKININSFAIRVMSCKQIEELALRRIEQLGLSLRDMIVDYETRAAINAKAVENGYGNKFELGFDPKNDRLVAACCDFLKRQPDFVLVYPVNVNGIIEFLGDVGNLAMRVARNAAISAQENDSSA
jgi:hypothetical protein